MHHIKFSYLSHVMTRWSITSYNLFPKIYGDSISLSLLQSHSNKISLSLSKIIVWTVLENTIKIDKILYQNTYSRSLASGPWSESPLEFLRESLKKSQSLFPFCPLLYRYVVDFGLYFQFGVKKDCYLWVITYHMHISYAKNLSIYVRIC